MDTKTVRKIGNSIGVTFNGTLASKVSEISEGDNVELHYKKGQIIIKKSKEASK